MPAVELLIRLPSDPALVDQIERALASHADVQRLPPQSLGLTSIALIASIAASLAGTSASLVAIQQSRAATEESRAATLKTLLEIKQLLATQGKAAQAQIGSPAAGTRSFAEADDAFLRRLLELEP